VRFSTLDAICRVLGCQPGDILSYAEGPADAADDEGASGDDTAGAGTRR
jgi:putative transcriptional regulator